MPNRFTSVDHRARRVLARAACLVLVALLAGCRSDSLTRPADRPVECGDEIGCRPSESAPVDPMVFAALDDARERLLPGIDGAADRASLGALLGELREGLRANRSTDARMRLALLYLRLDAMRVTLAGSDPVDLPDIAALRLALVPAANALGVKVS
jgi:hypothetical protein